MQITAKEHTSAGQIHNMYENYACTYISNSSNNISYVNV